METIPFYLPEIDNEYEIEARYAYIKDLVEEFTQEEVNSTRIYRIIYRLEGILVVGQIGELCAVYRKPIYAIFETSSMYVIVSKELVFNQLAIRKDEVLEVLAFDKSPVPSETIS